MKLASLADVHHFHVRTGFGAAPAPLARTDLHKDSGPLIQLALSARSPALPAPELTPMPEAVKMLDIPKDKRQPQIKQLNQEANGLPIWWLQQLHRTQSPLLERMTLFWHGHFTSNAQQVRWPALMFRQHQLLRTHALGSFADLLGGIWRDPAMLLYLNGNQNIARQPNENFARELLELFTLGEGHYTEADVTNAARAFTGWRYVVKRDELVLLRQQHDAGSKQFLGKSGHFTGEDIIQILLDSPRTAEFIAEKFWAHFINPGVPVREYIQTWAQQFRDSGYQIPVLLKSVLESEPFWDPHNRGALIKSPVEFTIGLLRELGLGDFKAYPRLANINNRLGQRLFYPPDVRGWRGGNTWLDNTSFVQRNHFVQAMASEHMTEMMETGGSLQQTAFPDLATATACLLSLPPVNPVNPRLEPEGQLLALLTDPVYQLR